jgi:O-antigen ligase
MRVGFFYEWAFSIALAAMAYAFALSHGSLAILMLAQGAVALIAAFGFLAPRYRRLGKRNLMFLCMLSTVLLSTIFFNISNYSDAATPLEFALAHTFGIIGVLFALQWAATNLRAQKILRNLAVLLIPLITLGIAAGIQSGGLASRQSPFGLHPNWWGELGFALTFCALALPHWRARAALITIVMVLFVLVQSRGALLAAVTGLFIYLAFSTRWQRFFTPLQITAISALAVISSIVLLVYQRHFIQTWLFLRDDVLLLNNSYRGIDTGLTGRLDGWQKAFDIFMAQPIFGQGFDTLTEVHNGFLRLAGEGGLMLLLVTVALIGTGLRNAMKTKNYLAASIILGYLIYAMTYPRMLNMNLAAAVFYLSVFPWKRYSSARLHQCPAPGYIVRRSAFVSTNFRRAGSWPLNQGNLLWKRN